MIKINRILLNILINLILCILLKHSVYAEVYGSISGRVYTENTGKGMEGCSVWAISGGDNIELEKINPMHMTGMLIEGKLKVYGERCTTDKDGNYVIKGLPPKKYVIEIGPGKEIIRTHDISRFSKIITLSPGKNITNFDFNLKKLKSISGIVYLSDGITPFTAFGIIESGYKKLEGPVKGIKNNGKFALNKIDIYDTLQFSLRIGNQYFLFDKITSIINMKDNEEIKFILPNLDSIPVYINGIVKDVNGNPMKKVSVHLYETTFFWIQPVGLTNENGRYEIKGKIPEGTFI